MLVYKQMYIIAMVKALKYWQSIDRKAIKWRIAPGRKEIPLIIAHDVKVMASTKLFI